VRTLSIFFVVILAVAIVGCQNDSQNQAQTGSGEEHDHSHDDAPGAGASANLVGPIIETMNAGGYTYVKVATAQGEVWSAAPECEVEAGQVVSITTAMPMDNFRSDTLDRTFDRVYFVSGFGQSKPGGTPGGMAGGTPPPDMPPHGEDPAKWAHDKANVPPPADVDLAGIEKVAGGYTVAEVYQIRNTLEGREVQVRGKVVKFLPNIMGKNWIHLRDGSGTEGTNDLTITTSATAAVGDLVVVKGPLSVNKDFGAGYKYEAIVEGATVTVE
jgi:hypothetical protein